MKPRKLSFLCALMTALFLSAGAPDARSAPGDDAVLPPHAPMGWDHHAEAAQWTARAADAVAARDPLLAARVPADIDTWCPGYEDADMKERRAFWVGLMSAVAKYESTWRPHVTGGGGRYIGLMQISPGTARGYGCDARTAAELKNGAENLSCAVRIFSENVARDGLVAGAGNRGLGRDWGPFHVKKLRRAMAGWTSAQPYCQS